MKRMSLLKTTILFASIITTLVAAFIFTMHLHRLEQSTVTQVIVDTTTQDTTDYSRMTLAMVSVADSIAFEDAAALATAIDMPEELPADGDTLCAYVANGTIFVEYYHGHIEQKGKFVYVHNE